MLRVSTIETRHIALILAAALGLFGCGDDDEESPREKCEALARTYCDHFTECLEDSDMFTSSREANSYRDSCEEQIIEDAECQRAVSVKASYGACLEDASNFSCSLALDSDGYLPASCRQVIELPRR